MGECHFHVSFFPAFSPFSLELDSAAATTKVEYSAMVFQLIFLGSSRHNSNLNMQTPVSCYSHFGSQVAETSYLHVGNERVLPYLPIL